MNNCEQVFDEPVVWRQSAQGDPRVKIRSAPDPLRFLALLGEPLSQILLAAEVHLVWCTTTEKSARDFFIVLTDVEGNETLRRRRTVEGVEKKPCVLQLSGPRVLSSAP